MYKRLAQEQSYFDKDYKTALKRAFLGTDEDILKGECRCVPPSSCGTEKQHLDPAFIRDPSGCTAVATLVTEDNKILCVRYPRFHVVSVSDIQIGERR